ncbi:unnamed protein product [Linum trigynum]|uniref:DUF4408 domain-containing protein n=1 Tax=Linum trigynum TaxID=586398 RepID=A0AAV2CGD3_9ROSI
MRKRKAAHSALLQNLVMNSLMIVGCTLLVFSPTKQLFFLHLPYILSCLSSPKCVFLLVNVIVVFLVGESRLSGYNNSRRSSSTSDVYDEYIRRARAQRKSITSSSTPSQENLVEVACEVERQIVVVDKATSLDGETGIIIVDDETPLVEDEVVESQIGSEIITSGEIGSIEREISEQEEQQVLVNEDAKNGEEAEEQVEEKIEAAVEEVEAKGGGDELNRRIEDFIARVNRRRQLEIQSLVSCKA